MRNPDLTDNDTLKDLKEPVAVYFTYVDAHKYFARCKDERRASDNLICR